MDYKILECPGSTIVEYITNNDNEEKKMNIFQKTHMGNEVSSCS